MVVHSELVFGGGVLSLLATVAGLELNGYDPRDQADLLQAVSRVRPNDVILTRGFMDLADVAFLLTSQRGDPNMRVIVLSPDDNLVHIFDSRQMVVASLMELFTLILGDSRSG
jgi:hypothetical protein